MPNYNYGFNLEKEIADRSDEDHIFGSDAIPSLAEGIDYKKYLPKGELQNIGEEKMDCASRSPLNILETKFNYLIIEKIISKENISWLRENKYFRVEQDFMGIEFSDAYIAIKSGTTQQGNSLKAPMQAIHEFGLVPKSLLPQVNSFYDYHNPLRITSQIDKLGLEFKERFPIRYDIVYAEDYPSFIKKVMLATGGYAWGQIKDGIYQRNEYQFNHAFAIFPPTQYEAFDNYIDQVDGDFIKRLAQDYRLLPYSYRMILNENKTPKPMQLKPMTLLEQIREYLCKSKYWKSCLQH